MTDYRERMIELVEDLMKSSGMNYSRVAALIVRDGKPISRQAFFKCVKNGTLRVTMLLEVLDKLGIEMQFVKKG